MFGNYIYDAEGSSQPQNQNSMNKDFFISDTINLSNNKNDSVYGQISYSNDSHLYLTWQDSAVSKLVFDDPLSRNYEIYFKQIDFDNLNKTSHIDISNNTGFSEHPQIHSTNENVYIAWVDDSGGNKQVLFRATNNDGESFHDTLELSPNDYNASNVELSASENNVYVVWQQKNADQSNIMLATSHDHGKTFDTAKAIYNFSSNSYPKIFSDDNNVFISWNIDDPITKTYSLNSGNNDNPGMFFIKSSDYGNTFTPPIKLNTGNTFGYGESQITNAGNYTYVVWVQKNSLNDFNRLYVAKSFGNGLDFLVNEIPLDNKKLVNPSNVDIFSYDDDLLIAFQASEVKDSLSEENEEIFFLATNYSSNNKNEEVYNISSNNGFSECPSISVDLLKNTISISWEDRTLGNHEIFLKNLTF
ncbi:MAG: hypothetical protein M3162_07390 [Thermoproteota archaeon]|nr:hypothetical protein [Thermoproteota archaeon]